MELSTVLADNQNQYMLAWVVYLFCATGFTVVFFHLTRNLPPRLLRRLLQWSLVVLIYTPVYTDTDKTWLVPAFLVGAYEYALGNLETAQSAGLALGIGFGVVALVFSLESILRKLFHLHAEP